MNRQAIECSPEFREFLQQVETALLKSSAEARRLAEQTGTKLIICESVERKNCEELAVNNATVLRDGEHHPAG
jgi:hypothetical protein